MNISDFKYVIGCDEVGYGCLAGPLVVVGVRAASDWDLEGLNDSKKLSEKKRDAMRLKLLKLVEDGTIAWHVAERSNTEIDNVGVFVALKAAYVENFHKLHQDESLIISDGNLKFDNLGVDAYTKISMVKADTKIPAVMAASILAKTHRDAIMKQAHNDYPQYMWDSNVGYPTSVHINAIKSYGPSPLHRFSYAPMKNM